MNSEPWEYDIAWLNAWQQQSCPPDHILQGELTTELEEHLAICPDCQENRGGETFVHEPLNDLIDKEFPINGKIPPQTGQLWSLSSELGGWGAKKRYYSAIMVLILNVIDDGSCLVSQLHDNDNFVAPGDISLPNHRRMHAESWNIFTLRLADMQRCWGEVASSVVQQVKQEATCNHPVAERSILNLFRQLEIETGFFFSSQAVAGLMDNYEEEISASPSAKILSFFKKQPQQHIKQVLKDHSYGHEIEQAANNKILLLHSQTSEPLQMAADDNQDGELIHGPLLTLNEQQQDAVITVQGYVKISYRPDNNHLEINGFFENIPCALATENLALGWLCPDGKLIMTDDYDYYPEDGSFDALFTDAPTTEGELRFCLIDPDFLKND